MIKLGQQVKWAFYFYLGLMTLNPLVTIAIVVDNNMTFIHGLQEMIIKFCFLILLHTMFRFKNIQYMLNMDDQEEFEVVEKLRLLVKRARIFLVFFLVDVAFFVGITGVEVARYAQPDLKLDSAPWKVLFIIYALFLIVWFCYYSFLAKYFWNMLQTYSYRILLQDHTQQLILRVCSYCTLLVVLMGSLHFFIYNAI